MTSYDVDAVTENQRIDDEAVVNLNLALLGLGKNNTAMMTRFCDCAPGGANASSPHCHLANEDYNITLMELLCNDQQLQLQQQDATQVSYVICQLILHWLDVEKLISFVRPS